MNIKRIVCLSTLILAAGCEGPKGSEGDPGEPGATGTAGTTSFAGMTDHLSNSNLLDNSISGEKIADQSLPGGKITPSTVTGLEIADEAIGTVHLGALVVTSGQLASASVSTAKLVDLGVTTAKLADLAVTTGKIGDLAVTTAKIADGSVDSTKLSGTLSSTDISDGTIVNADLSGAAAIAESKLAIRGATFSGRVNSLGTPFGSVMQQYGGANGYTSATSNEADVVVLTPNAACSAQNFVAKLTATNGIDDVRNVSLSVNGVSSLGCQIGGSQSGCSSPDSVPVPAGSEVSLQIITNDVGTNGIPPANLLFGWECR